MERSGKAGNLDGLTERAYTIFTPLLAVTDEAFSAALSLKTRAALGTNDRLHAGACLANEIGVIVSADSGFDGMKEVRRVDPLNRQAIRRLLA